MSAGAEFLVALVILVGLVGVVLPILPGVVLIFGAILTWAIVEGSTAGWTVFAICTVLLLVSGVVKYTWPGRNLKNAGVPTRSLVIGALLGIVGFFVIPILGLPLGFVLGVYLSEFERIKHPQAAWQATWHATKAVGLSILIELLGALLAAGVWLFAAIFA
ncbi:DUF456 domain-containing protein [Antrihabitans sp. YC2-6]|uniref:DUF456 domain-containing protein n=1 Tax=Antrihabitans sp. YC2-6 TaxID=2799498 RepID=UPI0018F68945|nr:DUF456 domain-containing protein [Antrihabitans sp. YC2-6]MBJ8348542.1 DUF456 domain-containing protein [Antrihabitans sp. YC2-6]